MTVLVIGIDGQVGKKVVEKYNKLGRKIFPISRLEWDMDKEPLKGKKILLDYKPSLVINLAAYTDVDGSEDNEGKAFRINACAPKVLAKTCHKLNIPIFHVSTDYVFDGYKQQPYVETDLTKPINVYGRTKLAGELAIKKETDKYLIVRTSWVFSKEGKNFVNTILRLANEREILHVVNDQIGGPTNAGAIADLLITLSDEHNQKWGVYHFSGQPFVTWFQFAKKIIEIGFNSKKLLKKPKLQSCMSKDFETKSKRPQNSSLSSDHLFKCFQVSSCDWEKELRKILK